MVIAIPTYNRENITTLDLLSSFSKNEIYIYVNNFNTEEQTEHEVKRLQEKYPSTTVVGIQTKGIGQARNAILEDLIDEEIVMMDDDIKQVLKMETNKETLEKKLVAMSPTEIKEFFKDAFRICNLNKTKLWGIYPIDNTFYMSNKINNKGFIIGTMFGVIKSHLRFDNELKLKEDYDFTLKHIIEFKKICRFDFITLKADHYSAPGGCVEQRKENIELEKENCKRLMRKYPRFLKLNPKRENEVLITL